MRTGRSMLSSISSKSLITGNVKIEESRKEIRNSPGAPSAPAKATIFCFQPFRDAAKCDSSVDSDVQCNRGLVGGRPPLDSRRARLSRSSEQRFNRFRNHVINEVQLSRLDHVR